MMFRATEEEKKFLYEYVPGHHHKEIVEAFNERFETQITLNQVRYFIARNKLNTGFNGRFPKSHIPYNKGKHTGTRGRMAETQFKKGNIPHNHKPVGSERITRDGYIEVKTAEPNVWKLKHRLVWEAVNGKIPKGYVIIFKDNDRSNCKIENLKMISRSVNAAMNYTDMAKYTDELKDSAVYLCELKNAISKRKNNEVRQWRD